MWVSAASVGRIYTLGGPGSDPLRGWGEARVDEALLVTSLITHKLLHFISCSACISCSRGS